MSNFIEMFMKQHQEITFIFSKTNLSRNYHWKNVIPFRFWNKFNQDTYIIYLNTVIQKILTDNNVNLSSNLHPNDYKYYEQIIIEELMYPEHRTKLKNHLINPDEEIILSKIAEAERIASIEFNTDDKFNNYVNNIIHFIREESDYGNNITYYLPFLISDKLEFKDYDRQYNYLRYILTHLLLIKKQITDETIFESDILYDYSKVFRELRHYLNENGKLVFDDRTTKFISERCLNFTRDQRELTLNGLEDTEQPLLIENLLAQYELLLKFCRDTLQLVEQNQLCVYINELMNSLKSVTR